MGKLINRIEVPVRFSEVDTMQILWHGHYVKYFEDGREAFGKQYDVSYMQIYRKGYMVPLVHVDCDFKRFLKYEDSVIIETEYVPTQAAKIIFDFRIFRKSDNEIVCTGRSIQVFLDKNAELLLTIPQFYQDWKTKWGV